MGRHERGATNNSLAHNWDYGDASPPAAWENPGKEPQSPINISTADVTKGKDRGLETHYQAGPADLHFKYPSLELKPQTDGGWGWMEIDGEK